MEAKRRSAPQTIFRTWKLTSNSPKFCQIQTVSTLLWNYCWRFHVGSQGHCIEAGTTRLYTRSTPRRQILHVFAKEKVIFIGIEPSGFGNHQLDMRWIWVLKFVWRSPNRHTVGTTGMTTWEYLLVEKYDKKAAKNSLCLPFALATEMPWILKQHQRWYASKGAGCTGYK